MLLATGVLAVACGSGGAPAQAESDRGGSVPACTAAAVQALEHRVTLTALPVACQGLSSAQLNLALGRAIYEVAGAGQHKAAWRRRAALAESRLAQLIKSLPPAVRPRPVPPPPSAPASRWGTGLAALAAWLLTLGIGAFMLVPWIRRGGLQPRPGRSRLGSAVPLGHAGAAGAGLLAWIAYLATGWAGVGWLAVGVLLAVIGLGMATLAVWTARAPRPQPGSGGPEPGPGGQAPARPRRNWIILPIVHGLTASATILLALLTVVTAR